MRRVLAVAAVGIGLVGAAVGGLAFRAQGVAWAPPAFDGFSPEVDAAAVAARVATYVRFDTQQPPGPDSFARLVLEDGSPGRLAWQDFLLTTYLEPMQLRGAGEDGPLVAFVDTPDDRPPVLFLHHADVVPVDGEAGWTYPPFAGTVADGFVWGRGALDNKSALICQLEALRALRDAGMTPSRDLVILVTHDEEVAGQDAARFATPEGLAALGNPSVVLDEGSYVLPDFFPDQLVAAVAVAEKTYVSFRLTVDKPGGHSSMPTGDSATDRLLAALDRLRRWETPDAVPPPLVEGLRRLGSATPGLKGMALANADLLAPLLLGTVQASPAGNAVTRDTVAITILDAGVKDNVVPSQATAVVNARLLPGKTPEAFQAELEAVLDDPLVQITAEGWSATAQPSDWSIPEFEAIEAALAHAVPGAVVIPSQTPGTMDARYFSAAGLPTFRIHPYVLPSAERERLHGTDERVSFEDLERGVRFYAALMQRL